MSEVVSPIACSKLTRCQQSKSSLALFVLDDLAYRTNILNHRISAFGQSLRISRSSSLPNSPMKISTMDGAKQWTCHACHAPSSMHSQVPSGLNKCPLDHYEGCPGGYVDGKAANGSEWRGCPDVCFPARNVLFSNHSLHY